MYMKNKKQNINCSHFIKLILSFYQKLKRRYKGIFDEEVRKWVMILNTYTEAPLQNILKKI